MHTIDCTDYVECSPTWRAIKQGDHYFYQNLDYFGRINLLEELFFSFEKSKINYFKIAQFQLTSTPRSSRRVIRKINVGHQLLIIEIYYFNMYTECTKLHDFNS